MGNAASSTSGPSGTSQPVDPHLALSKVIQERDKYRNEVFKQKSEMWELEDKYKDLKSRAEWAFNITFVSVILGAGYAAWTIRAHKNTVKKLALDIKEVRRRAQVDIDDAKKYGLAPLAKDILNVADDLERTINVAEKSADNSPAVVALLDGVKLTEMGLQAALERHRICKIHALGEPFDPHVHEAMMTLQDEAKQHNTVGLVLQHGYRLHDRVLRAARVGVVNGPPSEENAPDEPADATIRAQT